MDHRFIDENSIAEHYLDNALSDGVRREFERHLVDCQECTDRILLAGMFHARMTNGAKPVTVVAKPGLVVKLKPRQIVLIALISLLLISAIPALVWFFARGPAR
jgi:Putative zinc-finger